MSRRDRVQKSLAQRLRDLDDSLYLLRQELVSLRYDRAHLKSVATMLRALICESSGTEGLVWRLADELAVSDEMSLHAAEHIDRDHPLARGLTFAIVPIFRGGYGAPQLPAQTLPLREVLKHTEAVFIRGKSITHEDLIKAVAQQLGSAHESEGVDLELVNLGQIRLNNAEPYVNVLITAADLTLEIGERVLNKAERTTQFTRSARRSGYGVLTIAVRVQFLVQLAGRVPVIDFRSHIADVDIRCVAGPLSWVFVLLKHGERVAELSIPYPDQLASNEDVVFSLEYSSAHAEAMVAVDGVYVGEAVACSLGWLHADDIAHIAVRKERDGLLAIQFPAVFGGALGSERLAHLKEATRDEVDQVLRALAQGEL